MVYAHDLLTTQTQFPCHIPMSFSPTQHHCTPPPNAPTHTHLDNHQSLTPSNTLSLGSFPWHTGAQVFYESYLSSFFPFNSFPFAVQVKVKKKFIALCKCLKTYYSVFAILLRQIINYFYIAQKLFYEGQIIWRES